MTAGTAPPPIAAWRAYGRLRPYLRPYARPLLLVLVISLVSTALGLAQPYLSALLIDQALLRRDWDALLTIAGAMVVLSLGGFAINMLASYRYVRISAAMLFDIRVELLRHLQTLSPRFYGSFRLGDLMSRLNSDVSDIQRVASDTLLSVLGNLLFLVGTVGMMLWLDWRMFLVGAVLTPACVLSFVLCQRRLTRLTQMMRERGADLGSFLVDTVMGMRLVTALRAEHHELARFKTRNDAFVGTMLRMQLASFMTGALPGAILTASSAAVVLYGGSRIIDGSMTIGSLVAFMAYHARLFSPIQVLMGLSAGLASARVSLGRIFELFDTRPEVIERPNAQPLAAVRDGIRIKGVTLRHSTRTVLDGIDLSIPQGSFCAVLGLSGAGKSTFADLLVRFLDPDSGCIEIDGQDVRNLRLTDLRREVLLVDQAPHLFNDTIAANIAFAKLEASDAEVQAAAHAAGLDTLLARLPDGLQTRTGERGLALSAGERQRVALARALLRRPSVLILDEPSSALDVQTEALVVERTRAALPDATIILITHRAQLAQNVDLTITLADGKAQLAVRPSAVAA